MKKPNLIKINTCKYVNGKFLNPSSINPLELKQVVILQRRYQKNYNLLISQKGSLKGLRF